MGIQNKIKQIHFKTNHRLHLPRLPNWSDCQFRVAFVVVVVAVVDADASAVVVVGNVIPKVRPPLPCRRKRSYCSSANIFVGEKNLQSILKKT